MDQVGIDIKPWLMALKRRWLLIVAPVVLITPIVAGVAYVLPPSYSATARILIESQQIPENLAQSTVRVALDERIALIQQRLLSRQAILDMSRRFDVSAGLGPMSPTDIVNLVRGSTWIRAVRLGGRGTVTGVDISYTAPNATLAADMANEFMSRLLEQNIQQRTDRAFETSSYFRDEVNRLSGELTQLEAEMTRFKIENEDALPESLPFRRSELNDLEERVFERELQLVALEEQRSALQEALRTGELGVIGTVEEQELQRLQQTLARQRTIYADSHPSIRSLQSRISALTVNISADSAAAETGRDRVAGALERIDEQVERIEERRQNELGRIEALRDSIDRTPDVELALNALMRDFNNVQTQYREAVLKQAQAETGERLEVNRQAERFEVIEQAQVASRPSRPNRPLIVAAGFAGSLGLGFALALLIELLNRSIRTAKDLERTLDLQPIVSVPYIETDRERLRRVWIWRGLAIAVLVLVPLTLYMIDQHYRPLSLLAARLMSMTGVDALLTMIEARLNR